jgi:hypothetical protein
VQFANPFLEKAADTGEDLKCCKCRTGLGVRADANTADHADETQIFLAEDRLPEWIVLKIEEVSWNYLESPDP